MSEVVLAAGVTAAASIICQIILCARGNSLTTYRIRALEEKMDKLNDLVERMYTLEEQTHCNTLHIKEIRSAFPPAHFIPQPPVI